MASSSPFDRYHEEFTLLIQQIQKSPNDEKTSIILLQQCNDLIKQMSLEARSTGDADQKQQMLDKVKECKAQYQHVIQQSERQGLLAGGTTSSSCCSKGAGSSGTTTSAAAAAASTTTCLQKNEAAMVTQNNCLERAHRSMQETEQVAVGITQELDKNRETMSRTHGRIHQVSSLTGLAQSILNRIKK